MKALDCLPFYDDAVLYDLEFGRGAHDVPFYLRQATRQVAETGAPVLDLGCGTGRITLPLSAAGISVVGVDIAPSMIALARQKAAVAGLDIEWQLQDVRALELGRRFGLAFIASNAFQHLHGLDSILSFFRGVLRHLTPDGLLIIDVFNPNPASLGRGADAAYLSKEVALPEGGSMRVEARSEYLPESQILRFMFAYRRGLVSHTKEVHMRCFFPEELLALCRLGGFDVVARFGDHAESPFVGSSPLQILVCRPRTS